MFCVCFYIQNHISHSLHNEFFRASFILFSDWLEVTIDCKIPPVFRAKEEDGNNYIGFTQGVPSALPGITSPNERKNLRYACLPRSTLSFGTDCHLFLFRFADDEVSSARNVRKHVYALQTY